MAVKRKHRMVPLDDLLRMIALDRSSWYDVGHYPDTVTARRALYLADYAAANPKRWTAIRLHIAHPDWTQQQIADELGIARKTVCEYLSPLALPRECEMLDIYGDVIEDLPYEVPDDCPDYVNFSNPNE